MICSLLLDLDDSPDFPGDTATALGRPLAAYPLIAARGAMLIRRHFVMTRAQPVKSVALQNDAVILDPPPESEPPPGFGEKMLRQGHRLIAEELRADGQTLELLVVLFANAPAVTHDLLAGGIDMLSARPTLDSAISVSPQKRLSPFLAQRENAAGLLEPYVAPVSDAGGAASKVPSRGSGGQLQDADGEPWYPNWGAQILRPRWLDASPDGRPFPWLGARILPLKQWGGGPVDYKWQLPAIEYWLKKHGFADISASYEPQPKPQPKPSAERR